MDQGVLRAARRPEVRDRALERRRARRGLEPLDGGALGLQRDEAERDRRDERERRQDASWRAS
jgi:hypothetical protein